MRELRKCIEKYDVAVIGGGLSGICAAIAASREGVKTVLIQARSVLGGNASSEIRMHIASASRNGTKDNAEETGIVNELLLKNKEINPYHNFSIWDSVMLKSVQETDNLTLHLNLAIDSITMDENRIISVSGYQQTTETFYQIFATNFIDCTGNATVGYMAGAEYTDENECFNDFKEPHAPAKRNKHHLGSSLLLKAIDRGEPISFKCPDWAIRFTEEQLRFRVHASAKLPDEESLAILKKTRPQEYYRLTETSKLDFGYWWMEVGGDSDNIIAQGEEIRDKLLACVYGVWDHIKNGGNHGAENYDLDWVGIVPGIRESRRLIGDYQLNENDILANTVFEDAVAYGGWPVDVHAPKGVFDYDIMPAQVYEFKGLYTIPYRCYYSKNILNLFMAGRCISTSKLGMASTRIMGTCSVGGQAAGTAAAIAVKKACSPREVGEKHISLLQQTLLKNDCFIPGYYNIDPDDLARSAHITASSQEGKCVPSNVINGYSRTIGDNANLWEASDQKATLVLSWNNEIIAKQLRLTFDQDLNRSLRISLSTKYQQEEEKGVPQKLVRDYDVHLFQNGNEKKLISVRDNVQRLNVLNFDEICVDKIEIDIIRTNGYPKARVFEVRVY